MSKLYLSQEEQCELVKRFIEGDRDASDKLMQFCYPFIAKAAVEYTRFGCEFDDLIQEGYVGILHAIPKYRPEYGTKFITYALPWVLKNIRNYSYSNQRIQIPYLKIKHVIEYNDILDKIKSGEMPPMKDDEIAGRLNISLSEFSIVKTLPVSFLKENPLYETKTENKDNMEDLIVQKILFYDALENLPEDERYIFCKYYELCGFKGKVTYEELAKEMGCSTEWIRQKLLKAKETVQEYIEYSL